MEYYRTDEGKGKKRIQDGKRSRGQAASGGAADHKEGVSRREREGIIGLEAGLVGYVRMVTSLIEGRRVSVEEVIRMLVRALRQHSIAHRSRIDYVVAYLRANAP